MTGHSHPIFVGDDTSGWVHEQALIGSHPEHRNFLDGKPGIEVVVDRSARIEAFATIDCGTVRNTTIGARTYVMKKAHIGHDSQVGADCEISALAAIGGHCTIEDGAKVGMGAMVMAFRTVGAGAVVGTGAVVTKDVPSGMTVVGNPARYLDPATRDPRPYSSRPQTRKEMPHVAGSGFGVDT